VSASAAFSGGDGIGGRWMDGCYDGVEVEWRRREKTLKNDLKQTDRRRPTQRDRQRESGEDDEDGDW